MSLRAMSGAGVLIFAIAATSILATQLPFTVGPFWPANAVALVLLLRTARDRARFVWLLAGFAVGFIAAHAVTGVSAAACVWFNLGNFAEILSAYVIIRMPLRKVAQTASRPRRFLFLLLGALVGPAVGASLASIGLSSLFGAAYGATWLEWWIPATLAMLVIVPIAVLAAKVDVSRLLKPDAMRDVCLCGAALAVTVMVILAFQRLPLMFLLAPLIFYVAYRFRVPGLTVGVTVAGGFLVPLAAGAFGDLAPGVWSPQHRVLMVQAFLLVNSGAALALAVILDQRDVLLGALEARRQQAADQAQAKARLLMSVSHEIRTPLNAILGLGEMLGENAQLEDRHRKLLDGMLDAARHLHTLANDLLDTSRIEHGGLSVTPEKMAPTLILQAVIAEALRLDTDGAVVTLRAREEATIWADPLRFRQIAQNLVSNAVKYAGPYGPVVVSLQETAKGARLSVIDRGPGFPLGAADLAFEPFARAGVTPASGRSAGVGLSLVKLLAEAHGGAVGCASTPNVETRIWVDFPDQASADARDRAAQTDAMRTIDPETVFSRS